MYLVYTQTVINDDLFRTKFIYELSNKVFKCPSNNVRIQEVRAGSVIAIISGITLITLATVGLITLSVKMHKRRKLEQQQLKQKQMQMLMQMQSQSHSHSHSRSEIALKKPVNKSPGCMDDGNGPSTSIAQNKAGTTENR